MRGRGHDGRIFADCCHSNMSELTPEQREALPLDLKRIMTVWPLPPSCHVRTDFTFPTGESCV